MAEIVFDGEWATQILNAAFAMQGRAIVIIKEMASEQRPLALFSKAKAVGVLIKELTEIAPESSKKTAQFMRLFETLEERTQELEVEVQSFESV